jgi:hypothetical protein
MTTTQMNLTAFRRQFSKALEAADRGDIVEIKSSDGVDYIFARRPKEAANPFADLEHLFGVVAINSGTWPARDRIRRRLRGNAAG